MTVDDDTTVKRKKTGDPDELILSEDPFNPENEVTVRGARIAATPPLEEITEVDTLARLPTKDLVAAALTTLLPEPTEHPDTAEDSQSITRPYVHVASRHVGVKTPSSSRVVWLCVIGIVALLLTGLVLWFFPPSRQPVGPGVSKITKPGPLKRSPGEKNVILGPLKFHHPDGTGTIKPGDTTALGFAVKDWPKHKDDALRLSATIRIYDAKGKLLHLEPGFATFQGPAKPSNETLEVSATLKFSNEMPPGTYRVMIDVEDLASGRVSSLQTRLTVVANPNH